MHGVLNLIKPPGMTSHDAVAFVRRVLQEKRVGHTGTLDPAAAGVLPICVGQATRLVEYLQAGTKEYIAEMTFGHETDTLDAVGQTIREAPTSQVNLETLRAALDGFRGEITQTPPLYSAIKKDGQKLYEIARAGGEIEIPTRQVTISRLFMSRFIEGEKPRAMLEIQCSGGTYIRSLVRDIGNALGSAATMTFLVRNRSGRFQLREAISCEEFAQNPRLIELETILDSLVMSVIMNDAQTLALSQGKQINSPPELGLRERKDKESQNALQELRPINFDNLRLKQGKTMFHNQAKTIFALAVPAENPDFYKAEKVFDLREK